LFEYFEKGTFNLLGELEELEMMDGGQIRDYALLARDYYYHNSTPKFEQIDMLLKAQNKLDEYYILEKLGAYCNYPVLERILKFNLQESHNSEVLQIAKKLQDKEKSLILLYQLIHDLTTQGNDEVFKQTKAYFENQVANIPDEERKFAFFSLLNYSTAQHNKGKIAFFAQSFELNKIGLKHDLYLDQGKMTGTSFINIVLNALSNSAYKWANQFMDSYQSKIIDKEKTSSYQLSQGYFFFHQGQFQSCIDTLLDYHSHKINDILGARAILLRSYFNLFFNDSSYLDLFQSNLKSFEKFIRRANIPKSRIDSYLSLTLFLKKIVKLKLEHQINNNNLNELLLDLQSSKSISLRKWLVDFIKALN